MQKPNLQTYPIVKAIIIFRFHFRYIQDLINTKIDQAKRKYNNMSRKLSDKSLNPKKYWSLLKTLNVKKVPCIPSIYHSKFISKIKAKYEFF